MSSSRKKRPAAGSLMVIVVDNLNGDLDDSAQVAGPFSSRADAVKWIRQEALDLFDLRQMDDVGRCRDWGSFYILVEVREVLRPTPTVRVNMDVEPAELPQDGVDTQGNAE